MYPIKIPIPIVRLMKLFAKIPEKDGLNSLFQDPFGGDEILAKSQFIPKTGEFKFKSFYLRIKGFLFDLIF